MAVGAGRGRVPAAEFVARPASVLGRGPVNPCERAVVVAACAPCSTPDRPRASRPFEASPVNILMARGAFGRCRGKAPHASLLPMTQGAPNGPVGAAERETRARVGARVERAWVEMRRLVAGDAPTERWAPVELALVRIFVARSAVFRRPTGESPRKSGRIASVPTFAKAAVAGRAAGLVVRRPKAEARCAMPGRCHGLDATEESRIGRRVA